MCLSRNAARGTNLRPLTYNIFIYRGSQYGSISDCHHIAKFTSSTARNDKVESNIRSQIILALSKGVNPQKEVLLFTVTDTYSVVFLNQ